MQAVILAGGERNRLFHESTSTTKPMAPIFDRPVMEHTIRLLASQRIDDVFICAPRACREMVEHFGDGSRWGVRIRYSVEDEPRGTAGAVKLVQKAIEDTFVVISGDALTDCDFGLALREHRYASAVASLVIFQVPDPSDYGLVGRDSDGRVTRFLEKPKSNEIFTDWVSAGIYILEPEVLSSIPYDRPYDFGLHLIPAMLANSEPVQAVALPGDWRDIGNVNNYRTAHFDALQGKIRLSMPALRVSEGIWVGEGADIHPSVEISSHVYVGAGATVERDAVLGEFSVIGAGSVVAPGARIERSILGAGAYVQPETQVEDAVVATKCRVVEDETIRVVHRAEMQQPETVEQETRKAA